ncbi:MAG: tetratricopeptide repeat protein, partial [Planctomycetota bacterium]
MPPSLLVPAALLLLALPLPARFPPVPPRDEGDDAYRFLAGLVAKEMYELAVEAGEDFLRRFPAHPEADLARYRLAAAFFALDRRAEAAPHWRTLAEREGFAYRAEALFRLAQCELDAERFAAAKAALQAVLAAGEGYLAAPAGFLLAECEFRARDFAAAEAAATAWLARFSADENAAAARRLLAWCAWERGDAAATAERCRAFLARHGADEGGAEHAAELSVLLGEALLARDDPAAALAAFRSVPAGASHDAALRGAGFALAAAGDHAGAACEFAALLARYPASPHAAEAALQRGVELLRAGQPREAVAALAAADATPATLYWLARAQEAAGAPREALATL